jgi:hypothetical protein
MPEKNKIFETKIRQVATFSFKDIYRFTYEWLLEENYLVIEKKYSEKITPIGKEVEIEWEAKKKISDYFRFNMKFAWHIIGMNSIEVEQDGKKIKINKGDFELKISGLLEKDYEGRWEANAFNKFLRDVYDKYVIPGRIDQYEQKLFDEANEVSSQIKSFLAVEQMR